MTPRTLPTVTPLQFVFLDVLSDGTLTGKEMRRKLRRRGACRSPIAFYRVIQRLKQAGLVTARRVPKDQGQFRGAQCKYSVTKAGRDAVAVTRAFYSQAAHSVRQRWRRQRRHLRLPQRTEQPAQPAGASRSKPQ